ncbi:TonB-dependent receptor [Undibacterium fentianense]|uniref:TonB-dependent receptor n=1 Tax=Undibacterium fentianense TaxID=2828728 RepID=A0A941E1T3_9BURK|nr:TonB-dependent receptor [Undibacterium fentianense]MBR7799821.1 TonB-dependent receptor [Undibacterium fentianense]
MKQTRKPLSRTPMRLTMLAVACQLTCLGMSSAYAQNKESTESNEVISSSQVTITGKKVGMGLMVQENTPKARSTITAEELAKQRPTGNAYEALELMPAVNSYNYDATGLFGGGLTLRGFNSDQIGATINGVPVNDSGSFSVYPQEYVDQENTCTQFVTQGSTDVDSPQIGATGGNFGITTCDPSKTSRLRIAQTLGQLNLSKTYVRYDTGTIEGLKTRFFISGSHAQSDKWKGKGGANRDHIDAGFRTDFDKFNYISGTVLYNRAINQNISSFSLADLAKFGYNYDYATTWVGHAAASPGKAGSDTNSAFGDAYYQLTKNPFENAIASVTAKMRIGENTDIKVIPYFWYGYGTGGNQQKLQSEAGFLNKTTGKNTAGVDLNGDGDTLDRVIVANSSVTRTNRPGVTASVTHTMGDHQLLAGFWYERATHDQFGPMVAVDANGNANDIWLKEGRILRPDGTPFQSRDWRTISTSSQIFAQDTVSLMNDKLTINVGVRAPNMKRDFTNKANEGTNSGVDYHIEKTYTEVLPQLGARYQIDNNNQVFFSLAKNMKAPPNFVYSTTNNVVLVNNQPTMPVDVKAETSMNMDLGYRLQSDKLTAQATLYSVDFRDRQATAYDPVANISSLTSVGKVKTYGWELELGNTPVNGFSFYGSIGYANSEIKNDLIVSKTATLPTAGKQMTLTPEWKAGLSAMYETGSFYARAKVKYTGEQWATMTNDELVPSYTLVGLDFGYQFPNTSWVKKPTLRLNISNLTNREYRNPSSFNITNAKAYGTAAAKTVFYYMGSPRFASVTLSGDF